MPSHADTFACDTYVHALCALSACVCVCVFKIVLGHNLLICHLIFVDLILCDVDSFEIKKNKTEE